jgi:transcriptional regulator with XRE-family HTH domain
MNSECSFESVMVRFKAALAVSSDGKLAEKLGLSNSAYANLKKRGSIPYEKVIALAISYNVNIDWLFTGEGKASRREQQQLQASLLITNPRFEKLLGLLEGLTERQIDQIQGLSEEYLTLNRLSTEIEVLKQQLNPSQEGQQD